MPVATTKCNISSMFIHFMFIWLMKCWMYQCCMFSSAPCFCNKNVLKIKWEKRFLKKEVTSVFRFTPHHDWCTDWCTSHQLRWFHKNSYICMVFVIKFHSPLFQALNETDLLTQLITIKMYPCQYWKSIFLLKLHWSSVCISSTHPECFRFVQSF